MTITMVDFIEELDTNAKSLDAFKADSVGTAKTFGLSDEDVKLIESQNWKALSQQYEDLGKAARNIRY